MYAKNRLQKKHYTRKWIFLHVIVKQYMIPTVFFAWLQFSAPRMAQREKVLATLNV